MIFELHYIKNIEKSEISEREGRGRRRGEIGMVKIPVFV